MSEDPTLIGQKPSLCQVHCAENCQLSHIRDLSYSQGFPCWWHLQDVQTLGQSPLFFCTVDKAGASSTNVAMMCACPWGLNHLSEGTQ